MSRAGKVAPVYRVRLGAVVAVVVAIGIVLRKKGPHAGRLFPAIIRYQNIVKGA